MKRINTGRLAIISLVSFSVISVAVASLAWFTNAGQKTKESIDGGIGLRNYFYAGDGSEEHPFEIVTPTHFYNLSRLQNYGIFPEKTFFQIGHIFDEEDGYQCFDMESGEYVDYLDMTSLYASGLYIRPIGSESTPFHGTFDGHGIPVKNLKISGYPEDIGIFGYVAHDGNIQGLVCDTLEVESLGYTTITTDDTYKLFSADIEDIFNASASYITKNMNLDFYNYKNGEYQRALPVPTNPGLKNINGIGGVSYDAIDLNVVTDDEGVDFYHGYFLPTYPNIPNDPFTYTWSSSSSLIRESDVLGIDIDGDGQVDPLIMFDFSHLKEEGQGKFNSGDDMHLDARLSLTASVTVDGIIYSRVIQSYLVDFYSHESKYGDGLFSAAIYCNYISPEDPTHPSTNYAHGNNIGLLVGHLDGTMTHSYVYNGTLKFNDDGYNPIKCETQIGLVGEVGTNVINAIDPDYNSVLNGETGVMNFTRIYSGIRSDYVGGETIKVGKESGNKFVTYDSVKNTGDDSLFDLYSDYLRHTINGNYFTGQFGDTGNNWSTWQDYTVPNDVPSDFNSVDFLYNNIIMDEKDEEGETTVDRGLGVFKIATPRNTNATPETYGDHVFDNMGACRIINGEPHSKVYFSTAEYDHTVSDQKSWGPNVDQIEPLRATTIPSDSNVFTFDYPFSRDYNYVFEMDLSQNTPTSVNNFLYNTNSVFLTNYLKSQLIDKYGRPLTHGDYRFGFMFRTAENYLIDSLSSYMPIDKPGKTSLYSDGNYYPSNAIVFNIQNDNGANVSVVGNEQDISIYKYRTNAEADPIKLYTMKSQNTDVLDSHRYFSYNYNDDSEGNTPGDTSTLAVPYADNNMGDGGALYAHIFKLDKLPDGWAYAIGSSVEAKNGTTKAKLYYLSVQGQTDGTIGSKTAEVGNILDDVDFLIEAPQKSDYSVTTMQGVETITYNTDKLAEFNFTSNFNTTTGSLTINTQDVEVEGVDKTFINLQYNNDPQFITYLFAYDYKAQPAFCVKGDKYATTASPTYTIISS